MRQRHADQERRLRILYELRRDRGVRIVRKVKQVEFQQLSTIGHGEAAAIHGYPFIGVLQCVELF